jgi:hypothetical protein
VDPSKNTDTTFTGVISPLKTNLHTFTIGRDGELFVTLNSLTPPLASNSFAPELMVTQNVGGQCVFGAPLVAQTPHAIPGKQAFSYPLITAGAYCFWISDLGFLTTDESYVVTVNHP